tara:strand:- start:474 stop:938 length:465 start_codon:yes stop_codon:yes gene_type:complete
MDRKMDRKRSRKMGSKSAKAGMGTKRSMKKFTPFISFESFKEGSDYKDYVEPKNYQSGGSVMNDMDAIDMAIEKILRDEDGKAISDADRSRVMNRMRGVKAPRPRPSGMPRSAPRSYMEDYTAPLAQMKDGGEVGGSCRGGGAAMRGTKFRGVK